MKTMINPHISSQQGVGLIEVLVSLLLLAIAILGFSAMQLRAVEATDESMVRNRALTVMRGGAEMMRANPPEYKEKFQETLNDLYPKFASDDIEKAYKQTYKTCLNTVCSPENLAIRDARSLAYTAQQSDVKIRMEICPGTETELKVSVEVPDPNSASATTTKPITINNERRCFVTSWGDTEPVVEGGAVAVPTGKLPCLKSDGKYKNGASCFVMETY